jgi:hypothetical protein
MFQGNKVQPVLRAVNLTAICEPIVYARHCGILNISKPIALQGLLRG